MLESLIAEVFGLVDASGEPVPLTGVDVEADLVGRGARVTVAQRFVNTERRPIEAVYKFPLPESGAVCGFRVRVGDRVIDSEIEEREAAFRRYDEALAEGHGAYLLDEERPNVYTVSVGNLEPDMEAVTEVSYVGVLDSTGARVRFFLPTTISPRYVPVGSSSDERRRAGEAVNPDVALDVPYGLRVVVDVHDRDSIQSVASPSHHIAVDLGASPVRVELVAETAKMDRDFVLDITHREGFEHRGYRCTVEDETFAQVDLVLPQPEQPAPGPEHEVVFVVDCSGSMRGTSIDQARQALAILLRSLPEGVRFDVIRFGRRFERLFASAEPYTVTSAEEALDQVEAMNADLGGTEMLSPLQAAMDRPPVSADQRTVILITDGQISSEEAVVSLAEAERERNRVFTVGIGHGPNEYFVRQLARTSGGLCVMVAPGERIEPPVLRLFARVMSTPVTGFGVEWPGSAEQVPFAPAVHLGETTSIFARIADVGVAEGTEALAAISARAADEEIALRIPLDEVVATGSPMAQLWAREAIRDLEEGSDERSRRGSKQERGTRDVTSRIVELSRRYGVISRRTSFVAVETRQGEDRTREESVLRRVPVMLTRDWHGLGRIQRPSSLRAGGPFRVPGHVEDAAPRFAAAPQRPAQALGFAADAMAGPETARPTRASGRAESDESPEAKVLALLALQRPGGGFPLSEELADLADVRLEVLRDAATEVGATGQPDAEALVATAAVLAVLRTRFAGQASLWEPLVPKSERWLAVELASAVTVGGQPLEEWADALATA